jgi:transcriptional antiterminator RfaH
MLRWYLIHTKPANETLARMHLERQGFRVYFPRVAQALPSRQGWRERIVPLFPRYLFLQLCTDAQSLAPVRSTVGVAGIVRFGDDYTVVADSVVEELQSRADRETGLHKLNSRRLARGAPVRGVDRVVVLLSLLGQSASVCVPITAVMASRASFAR